MTKIETSIQNSWFDAKSFLVVLFAFIGDASVLGFDISLCIILPMLVLAAIDSDTAVEKGALPIVGLIGALLLAVYCRSLFVSMPYNSNYTLWTYKALALFGICSFVKFNSWPIGNMFALFSVCILLVVVGQVTGGRFVSLFGPNMLYRIFSLLLLFSLAGISQKGLVNSPFRFAFLCACSAIGLYYALLTGSVGALVIVLLACSAFFLKASNGRYMLLFGFVFMVAILLGGIELELDGFLLLHRVLFKIASLEADLRFIGWVHIVSAPLTVFGHEYWYYSSIWTSGYFYPHNILLELYAFYGSVGAALAICIVLSLRHFVIGAVRGDILSITFVVIFLGSLFSGDMADNFGVLGLVGAFAARRLDASLVRDN